MEPGVGFDGQLLKEGTIWRLEGEWPYLLRVVLVEERDGVISQAFMEYFSTIFEDTRSGWVSALERGLWTEYRIAAVDEVAWCLARLAGRLED